MFNVSKMMHFVVITYSLFFISRRLMKSRASSDTMLKASSSNSQSQAFTFFRVSMSLFPANGDSPDNLQDRKN